MQIAIVGGGVIGLTIAVNLAQRGHAVSVVERDSPGRGATWAAAGMLAPQVEAESGEQQLLTLLLNAQRYWPAFAADLQATTGLLLGYRTEGTLVVAADADQAAALEHQYSLQRAYHLPTTLISGYAARKLEPYLSRNVVLALDSPADHQVDPRLLLAALVQRCQQLGVQIYTNEPVTALATTGGAVRGVITSQRELPCDTVIIAAGAWSNALANIAGLPSLPIRPVKGQMLALQMMQPLLQRVVWGDGIYCVPRDDGRLLLGATVEEQGFNTQLTGGGLRDLLNNAWDVLPAIAELAVVETWAGLRPSTPDDAPVIGQSGIENVLLAIGHHRNGILLAPLTAQAIADHLEHGKFPENIMPFGFKRFQPLAISLKNCS